MYSHRRRFTLISTHGEVLATPTLTTFGSSRVLQKTQHIQGGPKSNNPICGKSTKNHTLHRDHPDRVLAYIASEFRARKGYCRADKR